MWLFLQILREHVTTVSSQDTSFLLEPCLGVFYLHLVVFKLTFLFYFEFRFSNSWHMLYFYIFGGWSKLLEKIWNPRWRTQNGWYLLLVASFWLFATSWLTRNFTYENNFGYFTYHISLNTFGDTRGVMATNSQPPKRKTKAQAKDNKVKNNYFIPPWK